VEVWRLQGDTSWFRRFLVPPSDAEVELELVLAGSKLHPPRWRSASWPTRVSTITNSGIELKNPGEHRLGDHLAGHLSDHLPAVSWAVGSTLSIEPQIAKAAITPLAEASRPALGRYGVWFTARGGGDFIGLLASVARVHDSDADRWS
jgi:hypothetical protein